MKEDYIRKESNRKVIITTDFFRVGARNNGSMGPVVKVNINVVYCAVMESCIYPIIVLLKAFGKIIYVLVWVGMSQEVETINLLFICRMNQRGTAVVRKLWYLLLSINFSIVFACANSYGLFPSWPNSIGHLSVTWPLTTTDREDLRLDVLQYLGEVNDEDVNMDDHLKETINNPSMNEENVTARYGRIEYAIGLVYEGECKQYLPHGYVCSLFLPFISVGFVVIES